MSWTPTRRVTAGLGLLIALGATLDSRAQESADAEAIRALCAVYERAVNEDQPDLLIPLLHDEFTAVTVTGDALAGADEVRGYWQRTQELIGAKGRYTCRLSVESPQVFGEVAVARGTSDELVVSHTGREFRFVGHWTAVFRRVDGAWKLLRAHASMNPTRNPFVQASVSVAAWMSGITAGILGVTLGVAIMLLARRKAPSAPR
ncbi:MAG: nuclear transport factor 2 family protein [Phycisphaerae bacterium]